MQPFTLRLPHCRLLPLWAALIMAVPAAGAEALIRISPEQLRTAGVAFEPVQAVNDTHSQTGNGGASLRLTGRTTVPNSAQELMLAPVSGRIESLLVNPGQVVRAGQALVRIHSAELLGLQRELVSASASADVARARAARDATLFDEGIIARNRLIESQAARADAEAQLHEHQQLLRLAGMSVDSIARIKGAADISPLLTVAARRSGTVVQQTAGPGQQVAIGDPLFQIAVLDTLWLELQASRDQALRIAPGDRVTVPGCTAAASVIATGLQLDSQSQTVTVRAELKNAAGCLAPNQYVEARVVPRPSGPGLLRIPESGIIQRNGRDYVLVREGNGLRPVPVEVERRADGSAWIHGGLKAGDAVASSGLAALKGSWLGLGALPGTAETP
jgi:cobalt-zinc-cadmium efflux system membrane fusion protein